MLATRGSTEGRGGGEFRRRYWECPAEWISETEALFSLELASCFTWRKQFPLNREEYYEHTLIFPSSAENPAVAVGVRRGRSVQVRFVMGRRRRITRSKKDGRERNQVLLAGDTGPSPGATPPGSGPPCGNLPPSLQAAGRARRPRILKLPARGPSRAARRVRTDAVLGEGGKPTAPRSSGALEVGAGKGQGRSPSPSRRGTLQERAGRRHFRKHHLLSGTRKGRRGAVAGRLTAPGCRVPRSDGNSPSVPGPGLEPRPLSLAPQVAWRVPTPGAGPAPLPALRSAPP